MCKDVVSPNRLTVGQSLLKVPTLLSVPLLTPVEGEVEGKNNDFDGESITYMYSVVPLLQ